MTLGIAVWVNFFVLWELAAARGWINTLFMPPPHRVLSTLYTMIAERGFLVDIGISIYRILLSFLLACAIAIPLGVLMGPFRSIGAFFNPFVSAWRYLSAPAFIPLLLMWFGAGEGSKLALLFIGVVFNAQAAPILNICQTLKSCFRARPAGRRSRSGSPGTRSHSCRTPFSSTTRPARAESSPPI